MMLLRDGQNGFSAMVKEIKSHIQGIVGERPGEGLPQSHWLPDLVRAQILGVSQQKLGRKMSQSSFLEQQRLLEDGAALLQVGL